MELKFTLIETEESFKEPSIIVSQCVLQKKCDIALWSILPMDMVYEILEFSNHAKLRQLRLMFRLQDYRLKINIPYKKKNTIVLQIPNEKKLEIIYTCSKLNYCTFKLKNGIPYIVQFYMF